MSGVLGHRRALDAGRAGPSRIRQAPRQQPRKPLLRPVIPHCHRHRLPLPDQHHQPLAPRDASVNQVALQEPGPAAWPAGPLSPGTPTPATCRSNSPAMAFDGHHTAQPQRGICGGLQISWMGKAGEPSALWLQVGWIIAGIVEIAFPSSRLKPPKATPGGMQNDECRMMNVGANPTKATSKPP